RRTTTFGYDLAGNVNSVTNGRGVVTAYGYNPVNRVESVTEASSFPVTLPPLNHGAPTTNYYYDLNGNVWWMTLPNGAITSYAHGPRDRLTTIIEAYQHPSGLERTSRLVWDEASNLLSVQDPRNVVTSFLYDNLDRIKEVRQVYSQGAGFDPLGHAAPITTIG